MAKKKTAAKPTKKPNAKAPAPKNSKGPKHLDEIKKLVHAPNTSKGIVDEVLTYLSGKNLKDKKLKYIFTICHQQETNTEKVQNLAAYLETV